MEAGRKATLFREVNERIAELLERSWPTAPGDFLCECGGDGCRRRVTLPLADYRGLRQAGCALLAPECARGRNRPWRPARSGRLAAST
jgi:hypothetical protein